MNADIAAAAETQKAMSTSHLNNVEPGAADILQYFSGAMKYIITPYFLKNVLFTHNPINVDIKCIAFPETSNKSFYQMKGTR